MLNRFYFLDEGNYSPGPGADAVPVAHVVCGEPGHATQLLEHQFSAAGNYPFCLILLGEDPVALAREVLLLLFHPSYVVAEKGRPVFVQGRHAEIEAVFLEQCIEIEVIAIGDVKQLAAAGHDHAGDYYRYCLTSYSPEDVFLLSGGTLKQWVVELERMDHELATNHQCFYRQATESWRARLRSASQEREIRRLGEEHKIMQELLELSNKHDEVNYILKFYRNEYEILPLWFKRIGHIVKVIQGKRSFRSLFDKRVKKYKD